MNLKIFSIIYFIQLLIASNDFKKCQNKTLYKFIIFLIHHLLDVYLFFGFLINETKEETLFHLLLIIGILIHWFTNNYECILTTYLNNLCKIPKDKWLYTIMYILHKFSNIYYLHTYWLLILIIYDIFKIIY